ncbi:MAG: hypothetical protein SNJ75_17040 [Gemmataceae bacterium]
MTYKQETYTEAVVSYQTRYYTEAVTSYRYSCAYNPCTCRYEQVAQPVVSYRLRAQCCPVTNYLQRTRLVPVLTQQAVTMYEPVTSCCTTSNGPAVMAPPAGSTLLPNGSAAPGGAERRDPVGSSLPPAPPGTETREPEMDRSTPMYTPPMMPPSSGSGLRNVPDARMDRMASRGDSVVQGRLTTSDRLPRANSRVLFVNADNKNLQYQSTTDADGIFRTRLEKGAWLIYTFDASGKPVFNRRIDVMAKKDVSFTLVSR